MIIGTDDYCFMLMWCLFCCHHFVSVKNVRSFKVSSIDDNSSMITIYVFIFMGVNFRGFRGHLVICENNFFVNLWKFFTWWIHKNFSSSVAALLAQWSISFKAPPYSLPCDDGTVKICTSYFFIFHHRNDKRIKNFPFLFVTSLPYLPILIIKLVITYNSWINKTVYTDS